ncbi:MAG: hypothetical protein JKY53_15065 [Flavobacteriales bacterium]|nr:hypothetical protein [Flavobacteriales bacterium]
MSHVILTKQEADAINKDIKDNSGGVLDKFIYGGWSVDAKAGKLKNGTFAMSRELIEEIQKRGGANATKIGGVDLKNRPDQVIKDTDRVKS